MSSKSKTPPRLIVIEGKEKGKIIPLQNGTLIIGRSKADIVIPDPRISRSHVAIHFDEKKGTLHFTDLKSLNGTQINGATVESGSLKDGDKLQVGDTFLDCQVGETDEVSAITLARTAKPTPGTHRQLEIEKEKAAKENPPPLNNNFPDPPPIPALAESDPGTEEEEYAVEPKRSRTRRKSQPRFLRPTVAVPCAIGLVLGVLYLFLPSGGTSKALEAEIQKIKILKDQKAFDTAILLLNDLEKKYPKHSLPPLILGDVYTAQGRTVLALTAYRKARSLSPVQPSLYSKLPRVNLRSSAPEAVPEQMQQLQKALKDYPNDKELALDAAELFLEFKDQKAPVDLAKSLQQELAPQSTLGYRLEAQILFQQDKHKEAVPPLEHALQLDPEDEAVIENLAFAKLTAGDLAGARNLIESWINLKPSSTKALLVMSYMKYNSGDGPGAIPYAEKVLEITNNQPSDPFRLQSLFLLGQISHQNQSVANAEKFLQLACQSGHKQSCEHELLKNKTPASIPQPQTSEIPEATPQPSEPASAVSP